MAIESQKSASSADALRLLSQLATNTVIAIAVILRGGDDQQLFRDAKRLIAILRQASPLQVMGLKRFEARLIEQASTALPSGARDILGSVLDSTDDLVTRALAGGAFKTEERDLAVQAQSVFNSMGTRFSRLAVAEHRGLKSERSLSK